MERTEETGSIEASAARGSDGRIRLAWRLAGGFLVVVAGLQLAVLASRLSAQVIPDIPWLARQAVQAVVMTGVAIPLVYLLRRKWDRRPPAGVGFVHPATAARGFLLGFGFFAALVAVPFVLIAVAGWGSFTVDTSPTSLAFVGTWIVIAFLFEALPEEIAIRGYLYRNLSAATAQWLASLIAVALFIMIPVVVITVDGWVMGAGTTEGQDALSFGYLLMLALFGGVVQYLRVVTGSVWACIGFHLAFLQLGRLFGADEDAFIRIEATNPGALDASLQFSLLVGMIGLIAYPWLARRPVRWRERDPECSIGRRRAAASPGR